MKHKRHFLFYSEKDQNVFDEFLIIIAGGLGALGIDRILSSNMIGILMILISFLIILFDVSKIRKKSDRKKPK